MGEKEFDLPRGSRAEVVKRRRAQKNVALVIDRVRKREFDADRVVDRPHLPRRRFFLVVERDAPGGVLKPREPPVGKDAETVHMANADMVLKADKRKIPIAHLRSFVEPDEHVPVAERDGARHRKEEWALVTRSA